MGKTKKQRLDKVLASLGLGSRKEVKRLIKKKDVWINGERVTDPKRQIEPFHDEIMIAGKRYEYREFVYFMLNKPSGVISATEDRWEKTVIDLLDPNDAHFRPFPVGRLDKNTEGLLILTNDGELAHRLLHPKKCVPKTYFVQIDTELSEEECIALEQGIRLDDGHMTLPAKIHFTSEDRPTEVKISIVEGKFHQVKRMFRAVGKKVTYLKRISMGDLQLDPALPTGEYRELSKQELDLLKNSSFT